MRLIQGFFDTLHFTECVLGQPLVDGTTLRVPVAGLFLLAGHPLSPEGSGPYAGELVFDGVADSRRTVIEYIGDSRQPEDFKEAYEIVDPVQHRASSPGDLEHFGFEGYQAQPSAWVDDWVVIAQAFSLHVEIRSG